MLYSVRRTFPIGKLTMACDDSHLVGVWIEGQNYFAGSLQTEAPLLRGGEGLRKS